METKVCTKCKKELSLSEFNNRFLKDGTNVRTSRCKGCLNENAKLWRKTIGEAKYSKYQKSRKAGNKEFVRRVKSKGCSKCGDKRHYVIDFHHVDPSTKVFSIGYTMAHSREALKEEMRKCILLCKNCHAEFHYREKFNIL